MVRLERYMHVDMELRMFQYVTDSEEQKKSLVLLVDRKKLSRRDLILILQTIRLNPDIFRQTGKLNF